MRTLFVLLLTLTTGCNGFFFDDDEPRRTIVRTTYGYTVAALMDAGGYSGGWLSDETVLLWLDKRVHEWAKLRNPANPEGLKEVVRAEVGFILLDARRIVTPLSPTGYAAGIYTDGIKQIMACIWSTAKASELPLGAPLHTADKNPADGLWYYGVIPQEGGLAVIGHELDHYIGLHHRNLRY